ADRLHANRSQVLERLTQRKEQPLCSCVSDERRCALPLPTPSIKAGSDSVAMFRLSIVLIGLLSLAACATAPREVPALADVTPFSSSDTGVKLPLNWQSLVVSRAK